jgi:hypothetical protein
LRRNNQAAAVEIASTLTGGHIPEGVSYPDEGKDFSTLLLEDAVVGDYLLVTPAARESDVFVNDMEPTINRVGRCKAVHPVCVHSSQQIVWQLILNLWSYLIPMNRVVNWYCYNSTTNWMLSCMNGGMKLVCTDFTFFSCPLTKTIS